MENVIRDHSTAWNNLFLVYHLKCIPRRIIDDFFSDAIDTFSFENPGNVRWEYEGFSQNYTETISNTRVKVNFTTYCIDDETYVNIEVSGKCIIRWDKEGTILGEKYTSRTVKHTIGDKIDWFERHLFIYDLNGVLVNTEHFIK